MAVLLKKVSLKDVDIVGEMEKIGDSRTYHAFIKEKEIKEYIENDSVFFIKDGNIVVGLISFSIKQKTASFGGLIIRPEFRRMGYARKALSLALKKLNEYRNIDLIVHPHNSSAILLYLSSGFEIESWKDNYFKDGEPRLKMVFKNGKRN